MPRQHQIDSLVDPAKATIDQWNNKTFEEKKLKVEVLRLDKIHPVISGNKWFKLKNYLSNALKQNKKGIASAGGAWSNHLSALAFACKELNMPCAGAIRGERPANFSSTLKDLESWRMQLEFVPREEFRNEAALKEKMLKHFPDFLWIPMGGEGREGIEGVKEIGNMIRLSDYSHICCAVGTGTFLSGLLEISNPNQQLLGICSLKASPESGMIEKLVASLSGRTNFNIVYNYHFGGFGKSAPALIDYMNALFRNTSIPTDFIYTGKLFFAIEGLASSKFFPPSSRILVIHSGGLQGNRSLPDASLQFDA